MPIVSWLLALLLSLSVQTPAPKPATAGAAKPEERPSVAPKPFPVLEGVVKGPDGQPLEKAHVFARARHARSGDPVESARTGATGSFRLPLKTQAPLDVWAQADGLALRKIENPPLDRSLSITLLRGASLEGVVTDGSSGSPVAAARVWASLSPNDFFAVALEPDAGRALAVTDAKGRFRLAGLGPGLQSLTATARGYARARRQNVRPGSRPELFLFPGASISGAVAGPEGKALPGALVSVSRSLRWGTPPAEKTDALGRFEILGLDPGSYDVTAVMKGLAPGIVRGVSVRGTDDERVILSLDPPTSVVGRVLRDPRHPVAARVFVQEIGGEPTPVALTEWLRADAGPDGRFRVDAVPPGSHVLGVVPRGFAPRRVDLEVPSHRPLVDLGDILVERGLSISGRVQTPSGEGVPSAELHAWSFRGRNRSRAISEPDGSYVLAGVDPGVYEVGVTARGFAPGHAMIDAGTRHADITLDVAGSITGDVVDQAARAVQSFTVTARRLDASTQRRQEEPVYQEFSSSDGRFTLEDVPPGSWILQVDAPSHASATVPRVGVRSGGPTSAGRIRLGDGGTLRGSVVNALGEPVAGATVSAAREEDYSYQVASPPQTQSDANGAYELRGIPACKIDVAASHPSYARGYVPEVDIDPEVGPTELKLVLSQGGRLEGTARRRDGTPVTEAQVRVWPTTSTGRQPPGDFSTPNLVGPDGAFVIEQIPAGLAQVTLFVGRGGSLRSTQHRQDEIREGETAAVDFALGEILVSGTVTRAAGPASGLRIEMRSRRGGSSFSYYSTPDFVPAPREGPERGFAITGEDGRYQMIVGEPGPAQVSIASGDDRVRLASKSLEIPDVDAFTADFDLKGVTVSGTTVDKETDAPVPLVALGAAPKGEGGAPGGRASSDASGRFLRELEPGAYTLTTWIEGYVPSDTTISVGPAGLSDVRIELSKGLPITGRLVDIRSKPVGGIAVLASAEEGEGTDAQGVALPDGSFRIESLPPRRYTLSAGSDLLGFALVQGVTPGDAPVTLSLRPSGPARHTVRNAEGAPVVGAFATLMKSNGIPLTRELGASSDAQGVLEVTVPYGPAELRVAIQGLAGTVTLEVKDGETASAAVVLTEED